MSHFDCGGNRYAFVALFSKSCGDR